METTASLLSPTSSPSSTFSFSPMPSPRHSPASSSSCSPASSSSCSFSFSPLPSPSSSSTKTFSAFPDLDISSNSSSIWNSQRLFYASTSPQTGAFTRSRPPPLNVSCYAYSTTAEPSQKEQQKEHQQQQQQEHYHQNNRWSSLSPSSTSPRKTYYTILGVSPLASPKEIRNAYRKLALQYHPDVSPLHQLDTSTKIFAEINEAYSTLADPQKRACYDLKLALQSPATSTAPMSSYVSSPSTPRKYTHAPTGRVYPSMNSFYREWRRGGVSS